MEYAEKLRLFLIFEKNRQKNSLLTKNNRQKNADFFAYTIYNNNTYILYNNDKIYRQ